MRALPVNWPKGFAYSPRSVSPDIHPSLLEHLFASPNPHDVNSVSPCIEGSRVHPALRIKRIVPPHPLAGKEVFPGHPQHGVFALKFMPKGTQLGEYVGEIKFSHLNDPNQGGAYCWRVLLNGQIFCVYSRRIANELSFINDYRGLSESPNVEAVLIVHRGRYYFGYAVVQDVEPFQELLVDYGASWATIIFK